MAIPAKDLCIGILLATAWGCTAYLSWLLYHDGLHLWNNANLFFDVRELMDMFGLCFALGVTGVLVSSYPRLFGVLAICAASPFIYVWFEYIRH